MSTDGFLFSSGQVTRKKSSASITPTPVPVPAPVPVRQSPSRDARPEAATNTAALGYAPGDPLLLTEREAAKALAVSPRKLWGLRTAGEIPCVRFGRSVRYDPVDLQAWIARTKTSA